MLYKFNGVDNLHIDYINNRFPILHVKVAVFTRILMFSTSCVAKLSLDCFDRYLFIYCLIDTYLFIDLIDTYLLI